MFKPAGDAAKFDPKDPEYPIHVVFRQVGFFGPIPQKYHEIVDAETSEHLPVFEQYVEDNDLRKPFMMLEDPEITQEEKIFISKLMKFDPRDRPSAGELLEDEWLKL
jgi:casein kinase II subunit alpha